MVRKGKKRPKVMPVPDGAQLISATQLCVRYGGRSHMWLVRRLKNDPQFPRAIYMGRMRFFSIKELEAYERHCASSRKSS